MNSDLAKIRDRQAIEESARARDAELDRELARRRQERIAPATTPKPPAAAPGAPPERRSEP
jgi:hypothetical protein